MPNLTLPPRFVSSNEWWPGSTDEWLELHYHPAKSKIFTQQVRDAICTAFQQGAPVSELVIGYAMTQDYILWHAWYAFELHTTDAALVAVGGYGRSELHLYSDIDVMILLRCEPDSTTEDKLTAFLRYLWDSGMEVGHSVRTLDEAQIEAKKDITVITALIESRPICGSITLYKDLHASIAPELIWNSHDFYQAKKLELQERHKKYGETFYQLEPNIKEGPGGLRDVQFIDWITRRHFGTRTLNDLVHIGFIREDEYLRLRYNQEYLWKIRFALQLTLQRKEDRLLFGYQIDLARQFGFHDLNTNLAVEQFMQNFYRHLNDCRALTELLQLHFEENYIHSTEQLQIREINNRFIAKDGVLYVRNESTFRYYPFAMLEMFLLLQQNEDLKSVSSSTIRAIHENLYLIDDEFRNDIRNRSLFIEILRQPNDVATELSRMHRYGVLGAYWPDFQRVVGRMQFDLYHVYTVDQHTLKVLSETTQLAQQQKQAEDSDLVTVFAQLPKPELLYLAALFHDIAKGRGGDHSTLGAQEAFNFCQQHDLSDFDSSLVSWLVENHLTMSFTAQQSDISDVSVIKSFIDKVSSVMRLNYLYLLTVADIRGTNPKLWNSWRSSLLKSLYDTSINWLREKQDNVSPENQMSVDEVKRSTLRLLDRQHVDLGKVKTLWSQLESDYFLRHTDDEIAWHTQTILSAETPGTLVKIRPQTARGCTEIFIYSKDRNYLFHSITNSLSQMALDILDARIITSLDGYALDTFLILDASGKPLKDEVECRNAESYLTDMIENPEQYSNMGDRHIPSRLKHFQARPKMQFKECGYQNYTLFEIETIDFPGLLATITKVFADNDVQVHNARISTLGERAHDIFYLTDAHHQRLDDCALRERIVTQMKEAIESHNSNIPNQIVV